MPRCEYRDCEEPALRDSEYCIFHKPEKNEKEATGFYKLIRQEAKEPDGEIVENKETKGCTRWVFGEKIEWSGYRFPMIQKSENLDCGAFSFNEAIFKEKVDCSGAHFVGDISFRGAQFEAEVNFHNTEFKGDLFLEGSQFEGTASYDNAKFKGNSGFDGIDFEDVASFGGAQFYERIWFSDTHFHKNGEFGEAEFKDKADFENVQFRSEVWFGDSEFTDVVFHNAEFGGGAGFNKAKFLGEVFFNYVKFKGLALFVNVQFEGKVSFEGAEFREIASFEDTDFLLSSYFGGASFSKELILASAYFMRWPQFVSTMDELETGIMFEKDNINEALETIKDESKVIQEIQVKLDAESEENFTEKLKAIERLEEIKEAGIKLDKIKIFLDKFSHPQAKTEGCREQRLTYEARGKKKEADQVFVHEMRARRETRDSQFQRFIDWLIADWTCRYGTSWQRVLGVSGGFILFFAFMYWGKKISVLVAERGLGSVIADRTVGLFGEALHRSIVVFTTLGYPSDYFKGYPLLQTLSAVESIIGALAVALIIIVFARQWMRG